ncbi:integrase catalytic domain-containing protein [Trichonephila clavipes]|nr:integrase catalytic domain-containing protein [Trichonephila clavipes]
MPYLDENGLIRLEGRLEFCYLSIDEKHPLILPKNSWLTTLIVRREHNKVIHRGTAICGLDFAGPLCVNNFGELQKSYIVLFTCGVTRALHLELVSDMTINSFLLAFRRFLARRGNCKIVRVQYFVRGGSVGHRSRASSKHLSPHLPVGELDSSGGQTGVALHLQMHVGVSGPQRKPTRC